MVAKKARRRPRFLIIAIAGVLALLFCLVFFPRPSIDWPDRRPVGELFLADFSHTSQRNPRGWFNRPDLDFAGPGGTVRFHDALMRYAERSIAVLKKTRAQGMIVWDLEGEEFPQKTSYIGDPRLLDRLAPEMAKAADEFFDRFRAAGLRVGLTIRPQQIGFDATGRPSQANVDKYSQLLLDKIDYSRKRWGATLFYVDSNGGIRWPAESFRLGWVARQRRDVLLIPEHHDFRYYPFSAPYVSIWHDTMPSGLLRLLYPHAFKALDISHSLRKEDTAAAALRSGDVLLFPAWFCGEECEFLEALSINYPPPS